MPTRNLIRFWCSHCQEYTVQKVSGGCLTCGTINEEYKLSDVPIEKVEAQRERYKFWKRRNNPLNIYLKGISSNISDSFFKSVEEAQQEDIVETDAGQKAIDERKRKEREKLREEQQARKEEYLKFRTVGRNNPCPCGSGKKYKYCCLVKYYGL